MHFGPRVLIAAVGAVVIPAAAWLAASIADAPSPPADRLAETPVAAPSPTVTPAALAPEPSPSAYVVRRVLPIDGPMKHGEWHWDDRDVPRGEVVITVDLAAQVLSIFRGGYEIGTAVILYGADAKPTPLGVHQITQKKVHHISNLYHAPMPYMLRLTNDGVAIHASDVADGYMTHGCIGVPEPFAKKLFAAVKLGDKVIVTRGETLDLGKPITAA